MADDKKKRPAKGKKPAAELTDDEAMRRLFPKPVREEARKEAEKAEKRGRKRHEP